MRKEFKTKEGDEYILTKDKDFPFCPHCRSKRFYYIDEKGYEGKGGDFNHYCENCKCYMTLKCLL